MNKSQNFVISLIYTMQKIRGVRFVRNILYTMSHKKR